MVFGSPTCEKPFTSAPMKPRSLTQRCSSFVAHVGILHRQRRQRLEAVGPLAHLLGEEVVGLAGELVGLLRIGDGLDRGRVERQDHHLDAVLIHLRGGRGRADRPGGCAAPPRSCREKIPWSDRWCRRSRNALRARSCPSWRPPRCFSRDPKPVRRKQRKPPRGGLSLGFCQQPRLAKVGGARRDRTADLLNAIQALSQLSYGPEFS